MKKLPNAEAEPLQARSVPLDCWLGRHADLPRADLQHLVAQRQGVSRAQQLTEPGYLLDLVAQQQLDDDLQRLRAGEPLGYVLGQQPFRDLLLNVDSRVLLPRPETEQLVEYALAALDAKSQPGPLQILDLGTGSGAIAIALAKALADVQGARITASDRSLAALEVAQGNAIAAQAEVHFICSDWFADIVGPFDLIVSNPPYIADNDSHLANLSHEPRSALVSGPDGLRDLRLIIAGAPNQLAASGLLMVEHGAAQGAAVRSLFSEVGFVAVRTERDYGGHERITCGCWGKADG